MTRGQQKIQSQQRNAKKQADLKKGTDQRKTAEVSLVYQCIVCKVNSFSKINDSIIWSFLFWKTFDYFRLI